MFSALETNFVRLLSCTENLVSQPECETRFRDYVQSLEGLLNKLLTSDGRSRLESLKRYELRLKKLNQKIHSEESSLESQFLLKLKKVQFRESEASGTNDKSNFEANSSISFESPLPIFEDNILSVNKTSDRTVTLRATVIDQPDVIVKERQRINQELREQLLSDGKSNNLTDNSSSDQTSPNSAYILQEQEMRREKLASEMINLARDLKMQCSSIGQRIRSDVNTVEHSIEQVHHNTTQLADSIEQLSVELGYKCGRVVWFLFFISIFIFFNMIFFIKLFQRRI